MTDTSGRHAGLLVAVAAALTAGAMAFVAWGPLPVRVDDWWWYRVTCPAWQALWPSIVVFAAIGLVAVSGWARAWPVVALAALVVLAFVGQLVAARQSPGGYNESIIALGKPGPNRYHAAATAVEGLGPALRDYPRWMSATRTLIVTHPAGPITLYWGLNHVFAGHERAAERFVHWCEDVLASGVRVKGEAGAWAAAGLFRRMTYAELAGVWLASFALRLAAALAVVPVFLWARRLYGDRTALAAAAFVAVAPCLVLFSPGIDQFFPVLAVTACWLGWSAGEERCVGRAGLAGLAISVGLFFSLTFAIVAGWAALLALAALWRGPERPRMAEAAKLLAAGVAGLALPIASLYAAAGYNSLAVWARCVEANSKFNAQTGRVYWKWALVNPAEFLALLGVPVACLFVRRVAAEAWGLRRRLREADWPTLILAGLLVGLNVSGLNRGETGRLWMFLVPGCAVAAAAELERYAPYRRVVFAALFALLAAQTAVLKTLLDVLLGIYRNLGG